MINYLLRTIEDNRKRQA